jgi:hypothetical protein
MRAELKNVQTGKVVYTSAKPDISVCFTIIQATEIHKRNMD